MPFRLPVARYSTRLENQALTHDPSIHSNLPVERYPYLPFVLPFRFSFILWQAEAL
jgi:hypothetical protein